jgi:tartrate-resistant acid phosphatase type 5
MAKMAKDKNTHFQFALGDNFYFEGVKSVDDPRFQTSFENAFPDENLRETPWFLNLG